MVGREPVHQCLKLRLPLDGRGSREVLYQLEHGNDVALFKTVSGRQKFGSEEDGGGEQALGGVVEKGVLSVIDIGSVGADDRPGENLRKLFRPCLCREIVYFSGC